MRIRLQVRGEVAGKGFPISLFIEKNRRAEAITGSGCYLPSIPPTLQTLCEQWRNGYLGVDEIALRLTPRPDMEKVSTDELRRYAKQIGIEVNQWLDSGSGEWQRIRDHLNGCAPPAGSRDQAIEFFLEIEDERLTRIPWQEWQFLERKFPETELVFNSWADYGSIPKLVSPQSSTPVRILVVVGDTSGIEDGTQSDVEALQALEQKKAEITVLKQPTRRQLTDCLRKKAYDIFVFTGHSGSDRSGRIGWLGLSQTDQFDIEDLTGILQESVKSGLQLCIFNSCDGLGLAHQLAELGVPVTIVMREPVPDEVAARFLLIFLEKFSEKQTLFHAFWQARQLIKVEFNSLYPGVRWLPKIFMGVASSPPTWRQLGGRNDTRIPRAQSGNTTGRRIAWKRRVIPFVSAIVFSLLLLLGITKPELISSIPSFFQVPIASIQRIIEGFDISKVSSKGEKPLLNNNLSGDYRDWKIAGMEAFRGGQYVDAEKYFFNIRQTAKEVLQNSQSTDQAKESAKAALKDFETLIYRNNAKAYLKAAKPNGKPVRVIAAVSPVGMEEGQHIFFGIAQAQQKVINANQVNLVVLIANDKNKIQQSRQIARTLSKPESEVLAIVGHYTTPNTCAALNHYSPAKLPVISSTSTVVNIRGLNECGDTEKVFFRTASSTQIEASTLQKAIRMLQPGSKIIVFYKNEQFSKDLMSKFLNSSDINIAREIDLDSDQAKQFLQQSLEKDMILAVFPDGKTVDDDNKNESNAFQRAIEVVKHTKGNNLVLGANTLFLEEVLKGIAGNENEDRRNGILNKLVLAADWHQDDENVKNTSFVSDANSEWRGEVNRRTAQSYEAVQVLAYIIQSLAKDPKAEVTREAVLQKLRTVSRVKSDVFETGIDIGFDENGDRIELTKRLLVQGTFKREGEKLIYRFAPLAQQP